MVSIEQLTPIATLLADSSEPELRMQGIEKLKEFMKVDGNNLTEKQCLQLWRALYYTLWLSDMWDVQQVTGAKVMLLSRELNAESFILWQKAFWATLREYWGDIDKHRAPKYLYFLRVAIAETFYRMAEAEFDSAMVKAFCDELMKLLNAHPGLLSQVFFVWWPESSAIEDGIPAEVMDTLTAPLFRVCAMATRKPALVTVFYREFIKGVPSSWAPWLVQKMKGLATSKAIQLNDASVEKVWEAVESLAPLVEEAEKQKEAQRKHEEAEKKQEEMKVKKTNKAKVEKKPMTAVEKGGKKVEKEVAKKDKKQSSKKVKKTDTKEMKKKSAAAKKSKK